MGEKVHYPWFFLEEILRKMAVGTTTNHHQLPHELFKTGREAWQQKWSTGMNRQRNRFHFETESKFSYLTKKKGKVRSAEYRKRTISREKGGKVSEKNRPLNLLEQPIHGQITETVNMWSVDNKYQRVLFVGSNGIFLFFWNGNENCVLRRKKNRKQFDGIRVSLQRANL